MSNAYVLILWFFMIAGVAVTVWGWTIIAAGRRTLSWPQVDGVVEEAARDSEEDDLLPRILFSYQVNGQSHRAQVEFPAGTTPTPEFTDSYLKRYPVGAPVRVFYNPDNVAQATVEPGMRQGDWMVFALGLMALVGGLLFLLFGE